MRARLTLFSVAACCVALAGCGSDEDRLDTHQIEQGILREVERDNPGTDVLEVTCPENVERKKGVVFRCRVRGSKQGQEAEATVTQVDDEGRVRFVVPGQ